MEQNPEYEQSYAENNNGQYGEQQYAGGPKYPPNATHEKALVSLITGITSIVFCGGIITGIGLGIAAIITGVSYRREHPYPSSNRSMATAGMTTGIIGLSLTGLIIIFIGIVIVLAVIGAAASSGGSTMQGTGYNL